MNTVDLPLGQLRGALWNPNEMDVTTLGRLRESIKRYGLVENLVVRPLAGGTFEVLSGNHRLQILREMYFTHAPCVVMELDDGRARLLAQALNHIRGEDNLGLRAELVRKTLETIPEQEVLAVLPETAATLKGIAAIGQGDLTVSLQNWQLAQATKLRHLQFQLTNNQLAVVEEALARTIPSAVQLSHANPNLRGNALFILCKTFLEMKTDD